MSTTSETPAPEAGPAAALWWRRMLMLPVFGLVGAFVGYLGTRTVEAIAAAVPSPWHWLLLPLGWIAFVLAFYYLLVPLLRWQGMFDYLSAMTFLYRPKPGRVELHLGSTSDILHRLRPLRRPGESLRRTLLRDIAVGRAELLRRIAAGDVPREAELVIATYFLSGQRLRTTGFTPRRVPIATVANLVFAYPAILLDQWLLTGRVRPFVPWRVREWRQPAGAFAARAAG